MRYMRKILLVKKKSDSRSHIAMSKEKVFPSVKNPLKFSIFFLSISGFFKEKVHKSDIFKK